jgi:hypothetical protein
MTSITSRETEIAAALAAAQRIQAMYERPKEEGPWTNIATAELDDLCRVQRMPGRIVVSFAGTRTKDQWLSNFAHLARMGKNPDGTQSHRGATEAFKAFVMRLVPLLRDLGGYKYERSSVPVDVEGHSRGGFLALEFVRIFGDRVKIRDVITLGCPRVGDAYHAEMVEFYVTGRIFRWTHNNDFVVCMPGAWRGYRHVGELRHIDSSWRVRNSTLGVLSGFTDGVWGRLKAAAKLRALDGVDDHRLPTGYIPALIDLASAPMNTEGQAL